MTLFKIIGAGFVLAVCIMFITLFRNDANLLDPPGFVKRLAVFLSVNSAATHDDHPFAELRTPVFDMDVETLYRRTLDSANVLGWGFIAHDSDTYNANFVVRSPILLFEDDVYIQAKPLNEHQSTLFVQSSSRAKWSRADFASNSGHIQELIKTIRSY